MRAIISEFHFAPCTTEKVTWKGRKRLYRWNTTPLYGGRHWV